MTRLRSPNRPTPREVLGAAEASEHLHRWHCMWIGPRELTKLAALGIGPKPYRLTPMRFARVRLDAWAMHVRAMAKWHGKWWDASIKHRHREIDKRLRDEREEREAVGL